MAPLCYSHVVKVILWLAAVVAAFFYAETFLGFFGLVLWYLLLTLLGY